MMSCPGLIVAATASTASTTYDRSGSLVLRSGVGTQMSIASTSPSACMSGRAELAGVPGFAQIRIGDVGNVALAGIDLRGFVRVHVEAGDGIPGPGELDRERQADVAEADDADARLSCPNPIQEGID